MSLLEFPIRRYQFTLIAFAMLVALGITAFRSIPRQEDPYFPIARSRSWSPTRAPSRRTSNAWW